jgi:tetratricopeptide (TPR) repeat protein
MNQKIFKGFFILALLLLIIPGLILDAEAARKRKKTAIEKKPAAQAVSVERKPAALVTERMPTASTLNQKAAVRPALPGKLDERWSVGNDRIKELFDKKQYDEGLEVGKATLDYLKESNLLDGQEAATTYNNLGMLYLMKGKFAESQLNLSKALDLRTQLFGNTSLEVAIVWQNISDLYRTQAQYIYHLHQKKSDELKKTGKSVPSDALKKTGGPGSADEVKAVEDLMKADKTD